LAFAVVKGIRLCLHVTDIRHTEWRKYEKPHPNSNWWTLWATYLFHQKLICVSYRQEGFHYCTAHKYSTETAINASRLINKFDHCYI